MRSLEITEELRIAALSASTSVASLGVSMVDRFVVQLARAIVAQSKPAHHAGTCPKCGSYDLDERGNCYACLAEKNQPAPALPEVGETVRLLFTPPKLSVVAAHSTIDGKLGFQVLGVDGFFCLVDEGKTWRRLQAAELADPVLKRGPGPCGPPKAGTPISDPAAEMQGKHEISHEECSECGRSFGDLAELEDSGVCVECATQVGRPEPAAEVTMENLKHVHRHGFIPKSLSLALEADIRANLARARAEDQKTIAELREQVAFLRKSDEDVREALTIECQQRDEEIADLSRQLAAMTLRAETAEHDWQACEQHLKLAREQRDDLHAKVERRTELLKWVWSAAHRDDEGRSREKLRQLLDQMFIQELDAEFATDQAPAEERAGK